MNDEQLMRYGRHILLQEIGIEGQQHLLHAKALIIGLGGLGSPAALFLASSGVGRLTLCDNDTVDISNLQRQIIHRTDSIGLPKVVSARNTLLEINPEVHYVALQQRVDEQRLLELVAQSDIVLDCSDNFATRYAINRACLSLRKPLVSGAAIQFQGQVAVFDFRHNDAPCYNCTFPEARAAADLRCATTGVFAPLVGIIGSMQAAEALKLLMGLDRGLRGKLHAFDALDMRVMQSTLSQDSDCPVCQARNHEISSERICHA